jgi:hypothetical protein
MKIKTNVRAGRPIIDDETPPPPVSRCRGI